MLGKFTLPDLYLGGMVTTLLLWGACRALGITVAYPDEHTEICARGHSETLRLPKREYYALRDAAFARAGKAVEEQCHGKEDPRPDCLILDHVIPLELCLAGDNCNRLDNIQIQVRPEAEAKDRIENAERARYCRGEETRDQAVSHFTRSTP
jgi:hypothetical protein